MPSLWGKGQGLGANILQHSKRKNPRPVRGGKAGRGYHDVCRSDRWLISACQSLRQNFWAPRAKIPPSQRHHARNPPPALQAGDFARGAPARRGFSHVVINRVV